MSTLPPLDSLPSPRSLDLDTVQVAFVDQEPAASEPPLVLLHGGGLDHRMWAAQFGAFPGRRLLVPDARGHGWSRSPNTSHRLCDDVVALLDALGIAEAVLVGLSMGGYIALAVARRHPDVLAGLVLADTRADPDTAEGRKTRSDHQALVEERGDVTPLVDGLLTKILADTGPRHAEVGALLGDMMRSTAPAGWIGALEAMKQRRDQTSLLQQIAVPTLVVVGEGDALAPVDVAEAMAKAIPGARLEIVLGAGHVANLENPEVFNRAFSEFLSTLPTGS